MRRVVPLLFALMVVAAAGRLRAEEDWDTAPLAHNIGYLFRQPAVQKELELSAEQLPKVEKLLDQMRIVMPDLDVLAPEERDRKLDELIDKADIGISCEGALARLMNSAQQARFRQMLLQYRGLRGLVLESVVQRLQLTDEQLRKIRDDIAAYEAAATNRRTSLQVRDELLQLLTPDQLAVWNELVGPKFDFRRAITVDTPPTSTPTYLDLLRYRGVQKDMQLTDDQRRSVDILWQKLIVEKTVAHPKSPKEVDKALATLKRISRHQDLFAERALPRVLSPEQTRRYRQLKLQLRGPRSFGDLDIADQLALTKAQREIVKVLAARQAVPQALTSGPLPIRLTEEQLRAAKERNERIEADLIDVLTPEQKAQWEELTGLEFDFSNLGPQPPR